MAILEVLFGICWWDVTTVGPSPPMAPAWSWCLVSSMLPCGWHSGNRWQFWVLLESIFHMPLFPTSCIWLFMLWHVSLCPQLSLVTSPPTINHPVVSI